MVPRYQDQNALEYKIAIFRRTKVAKPLLLFVSNVASSKEKDHHIPFVQRDVTVKMSFRDRPIFTVKKIFRFDETHDIDDDTLTDSA